MWGLGLLWIAAGAPAAEFQAAQQALGVPPSIAKITDASMAARERLPEFILVQDIHRHAEVQGNIAALLAHGVRHWGLQDIYLEGASANALIPQTAGFLRSDMPVQYHGLEDPNVYRDNVSAYEQVEHLRDAALQELETARLVENSFDMETEAQAAERWTLLRRLLQLRLKPGEYADYLRTKRALNGNTPLSAAVQAAEEFYELANERSHIFLENLPTAKTGRPQVIVVGGFHTAAMAEELKRQGRSYVVLAPRVTQSGYDDLYARSMRDTISALKLR